MKEIVWLILIGSLGIVLASDDVFSLENDDDAGFELIADREEMSRLRTKLTPIQEEREQIAASIAPTTTPKTRFKSKLRSHRTRANKKNHVCEHCQAKLKGSSCPNCGRHCKCGCRHHDENLA